MKPTHQRTFQRGIALISALIFAMFIFMIGGIFVTSIVRDFGFQSRQEASDQAYFLALSGVDFYRHQPIDFSNPNPFDVPAFTQANPGVVALDSRRTFEVYGVDAADPGLAVMDAGGTSRVVGTLVGTHIVSTGRYLNADGSVSAERTLIVPQGLMTNAYER